VKVLILESNVAWEQLGIVRFLESTPGFSPVLERDLGDETYSKANASVIVVPERCARHDSVRSLDRLRKRYPCSKILVHGEQSDPDRIAELITDGADGYFTLSSGEAQFLQALQAVASGATWSPREAISAIVRHARGETPAVTANERLLLSMLLEGLSNKEMAMRLELAEITVKSRLARLYRKFGVRSRVQLLAFVMKSGMLDNS
jgi:DNA-binding NarL/FixJ family response regulator